MNQIIEQITELLKQLEDSLVGTCKETMYREHKGLHKEIWSCVNFKPKQCDEKIELEKLRNFKKLALKYARNWNREGSVTGHILARTIKDILQEAGAWEKNDSIS